MTKPTFKTAAVIVAAGRGTRAGTGLPKQWRPLAGRRVADWTLAAFASHPEITQIVLVIHPDDAAQTQGLPAQIVHGGATRDASVLAGLEALTDQNITHVLVHDVCRAGIDAGTISSVITKSQNGAVGADPGQAVTDALWHGQTGIWVGHKSAKPCVGPKPGCFGYGP